MQAILMLLLSAGLVCATSDKFLGKYKAIPEKREHTAELAASNGNPDLTHELEVEFRKDGDEYHHKFSLPSINYHQDLPFKFNEEREGSYNNTNFKYKYTQDGDNVIKSHYEVLGDHGRKNDQTYTFTDHGFDKVYNFPAKNIVAKVSFQKV